MKKAFSVIKIIITVLVGSIGIAGTIAYSTVPSFRTWINEFQYRRDVVDQETDYNNRKMVEDTARALITNYQSAKAEYENYKPFIGSDDKSKEQRALDAKTSANMTASKYNNYLIQNNYVFKGNLPSDIPFSLEILGE